MLRFLLILITVLLFLILSLLLLPIQWIIGKCNPKARDYFVLRILQSILRLISLESGAKVTVLGRENIPENEAVLYVGNHRSYFDIILLYPLLPYLTGFVAKDNLKHIPLFSIWMKHLHCLFLDRENIRQGLETILKGIDNINSGISMVIFPEGTRNKNPESGMLPFKEGSLKMSKKTGCAVIPVAFINTAQIYENHRPFVRRAKITIAFGKPIYPASLEKEELKFFGSYTQKAIEKMLMEYSDPA